MGFRHPTYNWVWSVGDFVSMFQGESHYEESIKEICVTLLESAFQQNPTIVSVESKKIRNIWVVVVSQKAMLVASKRPQ